MKRILIFLLPFIFIILCSFKFEEIQKIFDSCFNPKIILKEKSGSLSISKALSVPDYRMYCGTVNSDYFTKVVAHAGDYYAIGNSNGRATLTRISNTGIIVWTREVSVTSAWNDLAVTSNDSILLVGVNGNLDNNSKCMIGSCTLNGVLTVKSYNYEARETLNKIYLNPSPQNSNYPYYIIGISNNGIGTFDNVLIINASRNGSINWTKDINGGGSSDYEFYKDIAIQSNTGHMILVGQYLLSGNPTAGLVVMDNGGNILDGRRFNTNMFFNTIVSAPNLMSGYDNLVGGYNGSYAQIIKISGLTNILYNYTVSGLDAIDIIIPRPGGGYFALGSGTIIGKKRPVILSLTESGNSLSIDWAKVLNDNSTQYSLGYIGVMNSAQIAYTDARQNTLNGIGGVDGFIAIENLNFDNCMDTLVNVSLNPLNSSSGKLEISSKNRATPVSSAISTNVGNFSQKDACPFICNIRFEIKVGNCGRVEFLPFTNQTGTLSYCWDFGDGSPCASTLQNPAHQYQNNGNYIACLEINDGKNKCKVCNTLNVANADIVPPTINCPVNITIGCNQISVPPFTGSATVSDNLDPSPILSHTDFIISSSTCDTTIRRTWSATDRCGNKNSCIQLITKRDKQAPSIICPSAITIDCQFNPTTNLTGEISAKDDCQSQVMTSFVDQVMNIKPCGSIITRTFTAEDICGNKSTCIQKITKRDIERPVIKCPKDITINCEDDPILALTGSPSATDNCQALLSISQNDIINSSLTCNIRISRTWIATDSCGNSSSCTQLISRMDFSPPKIQNCGRKFIAEGVYIGSKCAAVVNIVSPTVTDKCHSFTLYNDYTNTDNATTSYPAGSTVITWYAVDSCGNFSSCFDTVLVNPCKSCEPCKEVQIIAHEIHVDSASCCYSLDFKNTCDTSKFSKIEIESLTPGVIFGSHTKDPSWQYCYPPEPTSLCLGYPGQFLPTGYTSDVLRFCIDTFKPEDLGCWADISAGTHYSMVIKSDGTRWAWGRNYWSECGYGAGGIIYFPQQDNSAIKWESISSGYHHSVGKRIDGSIWAWGDNFFGQIGDGTNSDKYYPKQVGGSYDWKIVTPGWGHTVAIRNDGSLWAWGHNYEGQLGDGGYYHKNVPTKIGSEYNWKSIAAANHTVAIKNDGSLWAWGSNNFGQLGDGSKNEKYSPTRIGNSLDWKIISASMRHTVAIKNDGSLWAWGNNNYGQLGDGTNIESTIPTQIGFSFDWKSIAAAETHTVAIKNDGTLWAWGRNNAGQIGDGMNKNIPTQIGISNQWKKVSSRGEHNLALKNDGSLWAWGDNYFFQLGDKTGQDKNRPTYIPCESSFIGDSEKLTSSIIKSGFESMFKVKFLKNGPGNNIQSVACDSMISFNCMPDTISTCLSVTNAFAECLPEQGKYKIYFTIDNISVPSFVASDVVVLPADGNITSINPSIIALTPNLNPWAPSQTVMTCVVTNPIPDPDGILNLQFQLRDIGGNTYCNQTVKTNILLPSCDTMCTTCPIGTVPGTNLIVNPNFSNGVSGFTSGFILKESGALGGGNYDVRSSTNLGNGAWACNGHTTATSSDSFLVADGPSAAPFIWRQTVTLQAGITYNFCFWVNNLVANLGQKGSPIIGARLNGGPIIISPTVVNQTPDQWLLLKGTFTATSSGSFDLEIYNTQLFSWNDIAIDDLSLTSCAPLCKCEKITDVTIFNSEININHNCGKLPKGYIIECPLEENSFTVGGNLFCQDSCDGRLDWKILNNQKLVLRQGSESISPMDLSWNISNMLYSDFVKEVPYTMVLTGICGLDTCVCTFDLFFKNCETAIPCGYKCPSANSSFDFESHPLGNLVNKTQVGWKPLTGKPIVVSGGCNNSLQSLLLSGATRGFTGSSVEYGHSGVAGPDIILRKGTNYCFKFCVKLNPITPGADGHLIISTEAESIGNLIINDPDNTWREYTYNFTPTVDAYSLIFRNSSTGPLDYPPSIQIDEISIQVLVPVYNDVTAPIFDCPASENFNVVDIDCSHLFTIPNIPVNDDIGIETLLCTLNGNSVNIGSFHNLNEGIHQIVFIATDYCGNTAQCSYEINVHCESCPCDNGNSGPNIVENGDFEDGNVGFSSDYISANFPATISSGRYSVRNSTNHGNGSWSCLDHTNGDPNGNFLIADGPNPSAVVWSQTHSVTPGQEFSFCFFANNLVRPNLNSVDPLVLVRVNGLTVFGPQAIPEIPDLWIPITVQFVANTSSVTIEIFNVAISGFADLVIDDISLSSCSTKKDTCVCRSISDIVFGNPDFYFETSCNKLTPLQIPCPLNEKVFNIKGRINCSDSCESKVSYTILNSTTGSIIQQGNLAVSTPNFFGINGIPFSQFVNGELYKITFAGVCGEDTCQCSIPFIIEVCNECCKDDVVFESIVESAINLSFDDQICKAKINIIGLPQACKIDVESVNWGDGTSSSGSFGNGDMIMHTYSPANVSYLVKIKVVEYNANNQICNSFEIKKIVTPVCQKCCTDYKKFKSLVNQGFQVDVNNCTVTITTPQFNRCHYFDFSPDFGDGTPLLSGPISTNQTWTHQYTQDGTYNICATVYEYKNGDINDICWYKKFCTKVTLNCPDTCVCDGFNNMAFRYDKTNVVKAKCNDSIALVCPPTDCVWNFTGELKCVGSCNQSRVEWQLVNSSGEMVANGFTNAYPSFGIYISPSIVAAGGHYTLNLIGYCGNSTCSCSIKLYFPGCNSMCVCDPQDLEEDVNSGLHIVSESNTCLACFQPVALTECDQVQWFLLSNPNQAFASSIGNQIVCHKFPNPGNYKIKMAVIRLNDDGTICSDYEKVFTLPITCQQTFANVPCESIRDFIQIPYSWNSTGLVISNNNMEERTTADVDLHEISGDLMHGTLLATGKEICFGEGDYFISINIKCSANHPLLFGTKLKIYLVESEFFNSPNGIKDWKLIGKVDESQLGNDWKTFRFVFDPISSNSSQCNQTLEKRFKFVMMVENQLDGLIEWNNSKLEVSNVCLNSKVIDNSLIPEALIVPNPSASDFSLTLLNDDAQQIVITCFNSTGESIFIKSTSEQFVNFKFGSEWSSGIYFVKIQNNSKHQLFKIVKVN